jgi:hypothetical protein
MSRSDIGELLSECFDANLSGVKQLESDVWFIQRRDCLNALSVLFGQEDYARHPGPASTRASSFTPACVGMHTTLDNSLTNKRFKQLFETSNAADIVSS